MCFHIYHFAPSYCHSLLTFCFLSFHITIFLQLLQVVLSFCTYFMFLCSSLHFHLIYSLLPFLSVTSEMNFLFTHLLWASLCLHHTGGRQNKLSPSWRVLRRLHHSSPSVWTHSHTLFQGLGNVSMREQPLLFYPRRRDSKFQAHLHPQLSALSLDSCLRSHLISLHKELIYQLACSSIQW